MIKRLLILLLVAIPVASLRAGNAVYTDDDLNRLCIIPIAIKFDHEPGSDADGINIRENYVDDLDHKGDGVGDGEWRYPGTRNEPALYRINKTVKCKVKLQCYGWDETNEWYAYPITMQVKAVGQGDLGVDLKKRTVTFNGATSAWLEFEFSKDTHLWGSTDLDIEKVVGEFKWKAYTSTGGNERSFTSDTTGPHTFYNVFEDGPKAPWDDGTDKHEPWVSALEFANNTIGLSGEDDKTDAMSAITTYVHTTHGLSYDTETAGPSYSELNPTGKFKLTKYMPKNEPKVNCVDQSFAVATFAHLVGVQTQIKYTDDPNPRLVNPATPPYITYHPIPGYGYIKETNLVGVGPCNNPLKDAEVEFHYYRNGNLSFDANGILEIETLPVDNAPLVGVDDLEKKYEGIFVDALNNEYIYTYDFDTDNKVDRTYFSFHTYVLYDSNVYDATMKPHLGTQDETAYLVSTIDRSTTEEHQLSSVLTADDITSEFTVIE